MIEYILHGEICASFYLHASQAETLDDSTSDNTNENIQSSCHDQGFPATTV